MFNSKIDLKTTIIILGVLLVAIFGLIKGECLLMEKEIDRLIENQFAAIGLENRRFVQKEASYTINFGDENTAEYQVAVLQDSTVFSLLEELAQRENFKIETTWYEGMGVFVESIDSVKNGTQDKYWQYWVNGELPMVSADKMQIKEGDVVEWKFETLSF